MELTNRDEIEDEMLAALLLLWGSQREDFEDSEEFWVVKNKEDRDWLLYWLAAVFVSSARVHGVDQATAEEGAVVWGAGHSVSVLSQMRRHTRELMSSNNPEENIFGENRATRFVVTEVSEARSAGGEYAKGLLGEVGQDDLWFTVPDERRCPYCAALHLKPRSEWQEIYYGKILPTNPEFVLYGEPNRPPAHPNCRCFILYQGESSDNNN